MKDENKSYAPVNIDQSEQIKELLEALIDAKAQIEYLHNKFQKTGTSESVLNRLSTIIQKYEKQN